MSTSRQILDNAIQSIAKDDPEIRELLNDFRNSGGKPSESATSGSGAEDRQICCDGSSPGNVNPGSGTRDPNENPQEGIDPNDPAKISDNLTGVTDCATGTPICFAGSDWIPPEGWDGPTDPPPDPTYNLDIYAETSLGGSVNLHRTCGQALSAVKAYFGDCYDGFAECNSLSPGAKFSGQFTASAECNDTGSTLSGSWGLISCANTPNSICDEPAPLLESWPEDGCVNLAIKDGKIVGSKFDPENDGAWSAPRDELEVCDEFGNSFLLRGGANSTWKSIKSLNGDIDPDTGAGYLYRANGQRIRQISPSEFRDDTV